MVFNRSISYWNGNCLSFASLKFNQKSFDENDAVGKELLTSFLCSVGHNISENCDIYGIDFFSERNGTKYYWEVEMKSKRPWTCKEDFQFPSVSFLQRKEKWKDTPFWYVIICKETNAAIFCKSEVIFKENYKEKLYIKTENRKGMDTFYRVPKDLCIFVPPEEFKK